MSKILEAREMRSKNIRKLQVEFPDYYIVSIKANTPGFEKSLPRSYLLVDIFYNLLSKYFLDNIKDVRFFESFDGPYYCLLFNSIGFMNYRELKKELISFEDNHPLGRLIDLDLYIDDFKSVSRSDLGFNYRKCLVCDNTAFFCSRQKVHKIDELINKIEGIIINYFKDKLYNLIDFSILGELNLDPKLGLVTPITNGSHPDMDYSVMIKSKDAIINDFILMFDYGYSYELVDAFLKARALGKLSEKKMYEVTNGVNTYKGLIFLLGAVMVSLGSALRNYDSVNFETNLYKNVTIIGEIVSKDFHDSTDTSFGMLAFKKYGFLGARGELINGLRNVKSIITKISDFKDETLTLVLIQLINNTDDTVLLKRSKSLDKFNYYRNLVASIETYDLFRIKEVTDECIKNNISFGGSADLLIIAIFLKKIEDDFFKYKNPKSI